MAIRVHPLTADRWPDFERLFGERGACGGCWCMWLRLTRRDFDAGKGADNKRAMRALVRAGAEPGLLAYEDGAPVGWVAVAPRDDYPALDRSRVMRRIDTQAVWCITCFFIAKSHRQQGLTRQLLEAAVRFVRRRGGTIVEGYPVDPAAELAPVFAWHGLVSAFRAAGFREVARQSPTRPTMRRYLRPKKGSE
jgi:GNAT superfamily N-acetyltransferase